MGSGIREWGGWGSRLAEECWLPQYLPPRESEVGARSLCTQEGPELLKASESLPCAQAEGGSACSLLTTPPQWGREQCGLMR